MGARGPRSIPVEERFWPKVDKSNLTGCWVWTGARIPGGYGSIGLGGGKGQGLVHRLAYELCIGPIPPGFNWTIDHLCKNRLCVNPDHLELVSRGENSNRGDGPTGINKRKTHCKNGHPFEGDNLYLEPATGKRRCITCRTISNRRTSVERYHLSHPSAPFFPKRGAKRKPLPVG